MDVVGKPKKATMVDWMRFLARRRQFHAIMFNSWFLLWEEIGSKNRGRPPRKNNANNGIGFVWWEAGRYETRRVQEGCTRTKMNEI